MSELNEKDMEKVSGGGRYNDSSMYNAHVEPDTPSCGGYSPKAFAADAMPDPPPQPFTCGCCVYFNASSGTCMCTLI